MDIDPRRLVRALDVDLYSHGMDRQKLPPFHYMCMTRGKPEPRYCTTRPHMDCDCEDFMVRMKGEAPCKHLMRAMLFEKDPRIMEVAKKFNLDVE